MLLCGFLMIYGIVHVTAEQDAEYFAGLKAQGMTPRQVRHYLMDKGCAITGAGLIPGFLVGFGLDLAITSRMITGMQQNPAIYFLDWKPFAAAAICTLATVLLAYLLPTLRLSRKTPAQLRRGRISSRNRGKGSRNGQIRPWRLALRTFARGGGRTALSVTVMLLGVLLLTFVWMEYISFQEDLYLTAMSPWDYSIADGSASTSTQQYNQNNHYLTEETLGELEDRPEVTSVSVLKSQEVTLSASDELRQRIVDYYDQPYDDTMTLRESQAGYPDWTAGLDRLEQTGEYTGLVIGMEGAYLEYLLENCPFTSGAYDAQAFAEGDYVLAGGAYHEGISTLAEGESVTLEGETFQVMGSFMHDSAYLCGSNSRDAAFYLAFVVPMETFDRLFPEHGIRQIAVNIDHGRQETFEEYLDQYDQGTNRGVGITRRSEWQENFENARLNEVLVPMIVGVVLMGIALVNFLNMLVVRAISRKREFAVYQSLGMTRAQLCTLLLLEGVFCAALMAAVLIPVTVLFARLVMPGVIAGLSWISVYTFSLKPLWIILGVVLVTAVAAPLICLHFLTRGTIQERLGAVE